MFARRLTGFIAIVLTIASAPAHAAPAPKPESGLLITPVRQFLQADSGSTASSSVSVANLTKQPLQVNLSVKQFAVTDYVYNYKFEAPKNDWVHLGQPSVTIQPNKTETIPYTIAVPAGSAPGGHYYTLFASADLSSQGVKNTIQAADLLYFTVNGKLTTISHLTNSSIPRIVFGRTIPYTLDAVDTGNNHVFVYLSGELHGLFVPPPETSVGHILIPGAVRRLQADITSPVLPGIYKAVYGYKTDSGWIIQQSRLVLYIPPWFIAFLLAALLIGGRYLPRLRRKHGPASEEPQSTD